MSQEEFLAQIAQFLEAAGIPFMVAGSQSSSFHGSRELRTMWIL